MTHLVDGESELFIDDALAPILIITWIGPATMPLTTAFLAWSDEQTRAAAAVGGRLVMVHDGTAAQRPSADVRRAFGESKGDTSILIKTFVVVTNPLVRGAMTAIGWIAGDQFDVVVCKDMAEALPKAVAFGRAAGLPVPSDARVTGYLAVAPIASSRRR